MIYGAMRASHSTLALPQHLEERAVQCSDTKKGVTLAKGNLCFNTVWCLWYDDDFEWNLVKFISLHNVLNQLAKLSHLKGKC